MNLVAVPQSGISPLNLIQNNVRADSRRLLRFWSSRRKKRFREFSPWLYSCVVAFRRVLARWRRWRECQCRVPNGWRGKTSPVCSRRNIARYSAPSSRWQASSSPARRARSVNNANWHLAIVSNLGLVAGLRVNRDGSCEVLQVTPLFREAWTRQFVARDVRRLFIPPPGVRFRRAIWLTGRLVCEPARSPRRSGTLCLSADGQQWQELEVRARPREYHAWLARLSHLCRNHARSACGMEVQAESYQLHLHLVELSLRMDRSGGRAMTRA